jgi:predicted kinase
VGQERRVVYVSGAPGAGKSTLAVPLAAALGYVLISKDRFKETLHDAFGAPVPDLDWSRTLGAAAMELLWVVGADAPYVVLEANFRPRSTRARDHLAALGPRIVEVYCSCPPELALSRYNGRTRHAIHVLTTLPAEAMAEYAEPVGIGSLVTVDTTVPVDAAAIAAKVRALLG